MPHLIGAAKLHPSSLNPNQRKLDFAKYSVCTIHFMSLAPEKIEIVAKHKIYAFIFSMQRNLCTWDIGSKGYEIDCTTNHKKIM
jgi:hypothetical protein